MKLAILGDLHFGKGYSLGRIDPYRQLNSRLLDHANTMGYVIDYCAENEVSTLIITGDVFEHRRPEASQMAIFSSLLASLVDIGVDIHIVIGNHDLIRAHKTTTIDILKHLKLPLIHVWSEIDSVHIKDPRGKCGVNLIFLPFRTKQMLQCPTNDKAVEFLSDRLQFEIRAIEYDGPIIVVGHFSLQGAKAQGGELDSHAVSEIILPLSMFENGLDAVVMGHVHQHQIISESPMVVHIGSMERSDFGEAKESKYFLIVDTDSDEPSYEFQPLPVRAMNDIIFDYSMVSNESGIMEDIRKQVLSYANRNKLCGSITRAEIIVNDCVASEVDTSRVAQMLVKEFGVHHCVGVFSTVVAKRQLRSSEITEKLDPKISFSKWLDLEDDSKIRERLRKAGNQIIDESGGKR